VINNLEYDHADIFPDLAAIQRQFHHLLRMVPGNGLVLAPEDTPAVKQTLDMGCWSERQSYGSAWRAELLQSDGSHFAVFYQQEKLGELQWQLNGQHNVDNAVMAIAAARHAGVPVNIALEALARFIAPKRRMELKGDIAGIRVYDDFAHHPTAISTTLQGIRNKVGQSRVLAVLEPRSNTMRMGVHQAALPLALALADQVFLYEPANANWSLDALTRALAPKASLTQDIDALVALLTEQAVQGDSIVIMSNGGFGGIHDKLITALSAKWESECR
jgi:UDP-N-acetylmuramate: L-alanyl-gamma-D-glutamyl-meso-diaminopimelate ligase